MHSAELARRGLTLQHVLGSQDAALLADVSALVRAHIVEVKPFGTNNFTGSGTLYTVPTASADWIRLSSASAQR
jgi:hypothetical protein